MKRYWRGIIISLALGFGVVVATMLLSDLGALAQQALDFPWLLMIPALALRVANWVLRFAKWHFYLHVVGVQDIRLDDSAAVFVSGFVLALSPGKAAEALKSVVLKGLTGMAIARTLPVVAAERLSDGLAVIILLAVSIGVLAAETYWPVVIGSLAALGLLIVVLQVRPVCLWLLDGAGRLPLVRRLAGALRDFYASSYEIVRWRNLLIAVGLGTIANFLDGVGVYLILVGLGQPAGMTTFFQALMVISLSVVVGSLSALPGGLGAADLSIGVTLRTVIGLEAPVAGLATLLARFVQLWWGVIVGMIVGFVYRRRLLTVQVEADLTRREAYTPDGLPVR
ncbi:MAG: flippase-like domain-containing protein [Anaerolineae bacterium]|nr:flippase-like domain-containing protein [Anaerolineae bacterium]